MRGYSAPRAFRGAQVNSRFAVENVVRRWASEREREIEAGRDGCERDAARASVSRRERDGETRGHARTQAKDTIPLAHTREGPLSCVRKTRLSRGLSIPSARGADIFPLAAFLEFREFRERGGGGGVFSFGGTRGPWRRGAVFFRERELAPMHIAF